MTLAALSIDEPEATKDFLFSEQIAVDSIYQMSVPVAGLNSTPTLLILDSHGVVQRVFSGMLDQSRQRQFLDIIERAAL